MRAIVVGGGIGGLASAIGLLRAGWDVEVFERAPEFTEVGAGISLWQNGLVALDALGIGEPVRALGSFDGSGGMRDHRGRWLAHTGAGERTGVAASMLILHRAELQQALLDAVPPEVLRPGVTVHSVRLDGVVRHSGGESTADVVVGADGLRSAVRAAVWPDAEQPRYAGQTAWRIVLDRPADVPHEGHETWVPSGEFGLIPMTGDRLYCYAAAPADEGGGTPGAELAELRELAAGWPDPIPQVLAAAVPEQVLRNDVYDLPRLDGYVRGRVALLGDAAHAMRPYLGQGANQALEDAATLAAVLTGTADVPAGLARYDRLRRPRSQRIAARSRMMGSVIMARRWPLPQLRNLAVRATPPALAMRSMDRMLDWRPPTANTRT